MDGNDVCGPLGCSFADDNNYVARRVFELADEQAQAQKVAQEIEEAQQHKAPSSDEEKRDAFLNKLSEFEDVTEARIRMLSDLSEDEKRQHLAGLSALIAQMRKNPESCNWF
jgi:hypothetical protein